MDDADRLGPAPTGLPCGACGRSVPASRVIVVARRPSLAFLTVDCPACASRTLAFMTWDEAGIGTPDGPRFDGAPPVDVVDVLSMHTFLAGYEGDLRGLLDDGWSGAQRGFGTG